MDFKVVSPFWPLASFEIWKNWWCSQFVWKNLRLNRRNTKPWVSDGKMTWCWQELVCRSDKDACLVWTFHRWNTPKVGIRNMPVVPTTGNSKNLGLCRIRICIHLSIHWEVTSFCLVKLCWSCNLSLSLSMLGEPGKGSHVGCMAPKANIFGHGWVFAFVDAWDADADILSYLVVSYSQLCGFIWLTKNILLDY